MYFSKIIKNLIHYDNKKKNFEELREDKLLNQAKREVPEFEALLNRFERNISVLGKSQSTFENYARHVASISLYFGKIPTQLDPEQVQDYL